SAEADQAALAQNSGDFAENCATMREVMLDSAKRLSPNFPNGNDTKLTSFAYLGDVETPDGLVRVVLCRSIITGMLSPRGQSWVAFFDANGHWLANESYIFNKPPLWCEGTKLFFYGTQNKEPEGNVLDFSDGIEQRKWMLEEAAGSWTPRS